MQLVKSPSIFFFIFLTLSCSQANFWGNASSPDSKKSRDASATQAHEGPKLDANATKSKPKENAPSPTQVANQPAANESDEVEVANPTPSTPTTPVPTVAAPTACNVPADIADLTTRTNLDTIKRTLTLNSLLYDDGAYEFFPMVKTEEKFKLFLKSAISSADGKDFNYLDGWCQPFALFNADESAFTLSISSAGPDKQINTGDDIKMTWDGFDY